MKFNKILVPNTKLNYIVKTIRSRDINFPTIFITQYSQEK